jgi:regulator of replication initiation timing
MIEKLRNQYREVVKERDSLLYENKRIRNDYELYVKDNDQDKYCLRDELNNTRTRLLEVERDLLESKEQCVTLTNEINRLQCEVIQMKI